MSIPKINQIKIENFKSIGEQSVELSPFTLFVGPNGSGKSNFIDALHFVQESLSSSIELAFKNRGGISAVRRRSKGHPYNIGFRMIMDLDGDRSADYSFQLSAKSDQAFQIKRERCVVREYMGEAHEYEVREGEFKKPIPGVQAQLKPDRLALFAASATDAFRPVFDFLTSMRFYSIVPSQLREHQEPDEGEFLKKDGSNAASVLDRLQNEEDQQRYDRLCSVLSNIVEGVRSVEQNSVGKKETLQFRQDVGDEHSWRFDAINMSDGTLRVLGLLLAIYQPGNPGVVGIEEPESTVHPAVAEVMLDVLKCASQERQVLVTTHSPELLDHKELNDQNLRVVSMEEGETLISKLKENTKEAISKKLFTPGDLLRKNELHPDVDSARESAKQLGLFGEVLSENGS